jgi:uncharacterized hydrophobic protein (TIGR00271 family)
MVDSLTLDELSSQFEADARLDADFLVLTFSASLIASLGLLADSAAVVIGAMVIAPWILPLRAMAYGMLQGRLALVGTALVTLGIGIGLTVLLSAVVGGGVGMPVLGQEVAARTSPNLLDLGIALVAGAAAIYAKVRSRAVSSLVGTAIAVALVPPVCVLGLLASAGQWEGARGAGLLFATNLLGILSGALVMLTITQPLLRRRLWRSRMGLVSLMFTALLLLPLSSSFVQLVRQSQHQLAQQRIEQAIAKSLQTETLTIGRHSQLVGVTIDWKQTPPLIRASVRVSEPNLPTPAQVAAVQSFINSQQPKRYRLVVQRSAIDIVGPDPAPIPAQPIPAQP